MAWAGLAYLCGTGVYWYNFLCAAFLYSTSRCIDAFFLNDLCLLQLEHSCSSGQFKFAGACNRLALPCALRVVAAAEECHIEYNTSPLETLSFVIVAAL